MNKKLLTIQVLKQRITSMQQQLKKLEKQKSPILKRSQSKSLSKSKDQSASPMRYTASNKRYKSPTFWTGNALLGEENPYFSQTTVSPTRTPKRNQSFTSKSPLVQKIKKDVDLSFYQSAPQQNQGQQVNKCGNSQNKQNLCKKGSSKVFQLFRNTPKIQKKRTYEHPKSDPILNPQPPKPSSKKIQTKPTISPKNMFIQNPNSNPNLYFYSTQPITLSPKPHNNRNKSPAVKLLLSNSLQKLNDGSSTPTSSKKHFGKYFVDNFQSKWNMHW